MQGGKIEKMAFEMSSRGYALIGGGVFLFAATLVCVLLPFSLHTIEEGNIGIYYRQGALEDYYTTPGLNTMAPWITTVHQIKIRPQTETMPDISTVTRHTMPSGLLMK